MMDGTLNDRTGADLHVNTSGMEERKDDILDVSMSPRDNRSAFTEQIYCCSQEYCSCLNSVFDDYYGDLCIMAS